MSQKEIDDYLANLDEPKRTTLQKLRQTIESIIPKAEQGLSYGMPAFKVNGKLAMFFAGWKSHYSIYPAGSKAVLVHFEDELARYKKSRGTIKLPLDEPIPAKLIERIAKFRAKELAR